LVNTTRVFEKEWTPQLMKDIESHWHSKVRNEVEQAQSKITDATRKKYVLSMFPYPSGQLHMGHVRVYSISDAMASYYKMQGFKVFHPMGWDGFGLPAENAAIQRSVKPQDWTRENIGSMRKQLEDLGIEFDWERSELATCDPAYYKWTQWIFLKMFECGLAYQQDAVVNWDPVDQTVLADEQVDAQGRSWRSGAKVEKRPLKQWFLRSTQFSKQLYEGLDDPALEDWRDIVKIQQNWIGKCDGVRFQFQLSDGGESKLSVWTSSPLEAAASGSVAMIGVADSHILNTEENVAQVLQLNLPSSAGEVTLPLQVKRLKQTAQNPFDDRQEIPVFVIPDPRLFPADAESFLGIPNLSPDVANLCSELGIKTRETPTNPFKSVDQVLDFARERKFGGHWTSSKLQDWLISRQRYWGTPIPIVHCQGACQTAVPVPEQDLPVELPLLDTLAAKGESPLLQAKEWLHTVCPKCGGPAVRETDTMDTFVDSSWYFLRYLDHKNKNEIVSKDKAKAGMPVDLYIGGKEHATLHMFFARFISHFLHSIGVSPVKEPFQRLLVQGMVKGQSFRLKGSSQQYLPKSQVKFEGDKAFDIESGSPLVVEWEKMSKSKFNGVDPGDVLKTYGMDATRLLILSDVSPLSDRKWNPEDSFIRISNMQKRLVKLVYMAIERQENLDQIPTLTPDKIQTETDKFWDARNFYVRGANHAYACTRNLSMVMARVQGLISELWGSHGYTKATNPEYQRGLASAIILLTPLAPHFCAELWAGLQSTKTKNCQDYHWDKSVFHQPWPELDPNYNLKLILRKNGDVMEEVPIAVWRFREMQEQEAFDLACCVPKVQDEILPLDNVRRRFSKEVDYEAVLDFDFTLSKEQLQEKRRKIQEEKKRKKERKAAKLAKAANEEATK